MMDPISALELITVYLGKWQREVLSQIKVGSAGVTVW